MDNSLSVPLVAQFDDEKLLRLHRRQEQFEFERVFTIDDVIVRYYSDEQLYCVGEYVKDTLKKNKEHGSLSTFVYLEKVDENLAYALHVKNNIVVAESFLEYSLLVRNFNYKVYTTKLLASDKKLLDLFVDVAIEGSTFLIDKIDISDIPKEYLLLSLSKSVSLSDTLKKSLVGSLLLGVIGVGGYYAYDFLNPPPPPPPPPLNPVEIWRDELGIKVVAAPVLQNAANVIANFLLMPNDWSISTITFESELLTAQIAPTSSKSLLVNLNEWLKYDENKFISNNFDKDTLQFTFGINKRPDEVWFVLDNYPNEFVDFLKIMDAEGISMERKEDIGLVNQYQFGFNFNNVSISMLETLADYFKDKPFSIDTFSVDSISLDGISFSMSVTLQGIQNEQ